MNNDSPFFQLSEEETMRLRQLVNEDMRAGGEYDPNESSNFWEAAGHASDESLARIKSLLDAGEYVAAHAAMTLISYDYWFDYVARLRREQAIDELAQEAYDQSNNRRYAVMH